MKLLNLIEKSQINKLLINQNLLKAIECIYRSHHSCRRKAGNNRYRDVKCYTMLCLCYVYVMFICVYCQVLDFHCFLLQDFNHSEVSHMSSFNSPITNLPGFDLELFTLGSSFKLKTYQVLQIFQLFIIAVFQIQKHPFADILQNRCS